MKIVFIVDNYSGGAGNIVQLLATEYAKESNVTVLLTHKTCEKRYECKNVKFVELDAKDKPKKYIQNVLFQIKWIKKNIKKEKPDVVISFLTLNSVFVCLGQLFSNIPIIACERVDPTKTKFNFPWNILKRISYKRANLLTVQFESFRKFDNERYINKCMVTPNYIVKPECVKNIENLNDFTHFVSCGRLNDSKQFGIMITIFKEIHEKNKNTDLSIYGKGPFEERLKNQIKELDLCDCVFLRGYANNVHQILQKSDIYLMTSKQEGFPNALSEAMAVGLPSIAFRCNEGIDELSDYGERCAVVDLNDINTFVNIALDLCENCEKCKEYSENAKVVSEKYSLIGIKKNWDTCIEQVIN